MTKQTWQTILVLAVCAFILLWVYLPISFGQSPTAIISPSGGITYVYPGQGGAATVVVPPVYTAPPPTVYTEPPSVYSAPHPYQWDGGNYADHLK
jgi:hypothetical protein